MKPKIFQTIIHIYFARHINYHYIYIKLPIIVSTIIYFFDLVDFLSLANEQILGKNRPNDLYHLLKCASLWV